MFVPHGLNKRRNSYSLESLEDKNETLEEKNETLEEKNESLEDKNTNSCP